MLRLFIQGPRNQNQQSNFSNHTSRSSPVGTFHNTTTYSTVGSTGQRDDGTTSCLCVSPTPVGIMETLSLQNCCNAAGLSHGSSSNCSGSSSTSSTSSQDKDAGEHIIPQVRWVLVVANAPSATQKSHSTRQASHRNAAAAAGSIPEVVAAQQQGRLFTLPQQLTQPPYAQQRALYADSRHPGARALISRLGPIFKGADTTTTTTTTTTADTSHTSSSSSSSSNSGSSSGSLQVLVGCMGWLMDLCTEFTGSPTQTLPIINPESPQWSTGNATYGDLQLLLREIRIAARARSLPRLKLGLLMTGWAHLYNLKGSFASRHPEVFSSDGTRFAHGLAWHMHGDNYRYATRPAGVAPNASFYELFGAQWGALSDFLGLDAVVLRDGLSTYANHGRHGPFGETASSTRAANDLWLNGVRELFRTTKTAAPLRLVVGYSQAVSAVAGWRVALSDLEQVAADGYIDAWVDQSWSGAWEDVPTRKSKTLGWTFHLAYILLHRAQLEGGNRRRRALKRPPCRHYALHGLFDAYEGFDTIHTVPEKLQWGLWAYTLAALVRPNGELVRGDGHYMSWVNSYSYVSGSLDNPLDDDSYLDRPMGLLTRTDIAWLASELAAADAARAATTNAANLPGPTVYYNRAALDAVMAERPADNFNEWIDTQMGVLLKYGLPLLKVARLEDGIATVGPTAARGGVILSVPSSASAAGKKGSEKSQLAANLTSLAAEGAPVILLGRCDLIDPELMALVGGISCANNRTRENNTKSSYYYNNSYHQNSGSGTNYYYGPATLHATAGSSSSSKARTITVALTAPRGVILSSNSSSNISNKSSIKKDGHGSVVAQVVGGGGGAAEALLTLADGTITMARVRNATRAVAWAQLSDFTSPVTAEMSVANYGQAALHYALLEATRAPWPFVSVYEGLSENSPVTVHAWWETVPITQLLLGSTTNTRAAAPDNTVVVTDHTHTDHKPVAPSHARRRIGLLVGNLESNHCGNVPCSVPSQLSGRNITLRLNISGCSSSDGCFSGLGGSGQGAWIMTCRGAAREGSQLVRPHSDEVGALYLHFNLGLSDSRICYLETL